MLVILYCAAKCRIFETITVVSLTSVTSKAEATILFLHPSSFSWTGSYAEAKYAGNNQPQYYNSQNNNYESDDSVVTNNAFSTDDAVNGGSTSGVQKAYLPPVNQASQRRSSFNARSGYRY